MGFFEKAGNDGTTVEAGKTQAVLGLPPDADGNGNYAFFGAANYALIQMTGGVTAIPYPETRSPARVPWRIKSRSR